MIICEKSGCITTLQENRDFGSRISEKKLPKSGIVRSPKPVFKSTI